MKHSGACLALSGLFWGLAAHTHPTVLALAPGAALYLVWTGRPLLRTAWPYLALALFILANLNLLVYNLTTSFDSLTYGREVASSGFYTAREELSPAVYFGRVERLLLALLRAMAGALDLRSGGIDAYLADLGLWPIALLAIASVVWQWRRGNPLPGLVLASAVLSLALFSGRPDFLLNGRYLAPLLPLLYAAAGALLAQGFAGLRSAGQASPALFPSRFQLRRIGLELLSAFLVLHPLLYLQRYYEQERSAGRTNRPIYETVERIQASREASEIVVLDPSLHARQSSGNGRLDNTFRMVLAIDGIPFRLVDREAGERLDAEARCRDRLLLLAARQSVFDDLSASLGLLDFRPGPALLQTSAFGLYQLGRRQDAGSC